MAKRKGGKGAKCAKSAASSSWLKITTKSGKKYRIAGLLSSGGERWVQVRSGADQAYVRYAQFGGKGDQARALLAEQGVVVIGTPNWSAIRDAVDTLQRFKRTPLLEQSGWTAGHFALPDNRVFSPPGESTPVVVFPADLVKCAHAGTLAGWRKGAARPLLGQTILGFMLMTMFAPPLLKLTNRVGNYGFEFVSEGGKGKSTVLQLMSSVAGGAMPGAPGHYWMTCNTTATALENIMAQHSDLPLLLDEAAEYAATGTARTRGDSFRGLVFNLAAGTTRTRWNGPPQAEYRLIYVMTTKKSLARAVWRGLCGGWGLRWTVSSRSRSMTGSVHMEPSTRCRPNTQVPRRLRQRSPVRRPRITGWRCRSSSIAL